MSGRAEDLAGLFVRDLDRLADAVGQYPDDTSIWVMAGEIPNPGGTLALHLAGNLRHFVGALLGEDGYVRNRAREFSARDLTRSDIQREVREARVVVDRVLRRLADARLDDPWTGGGPLGPEATVLSMLAHLYGHLTYHLGQLDYHRRGVIRARE